MVNTPVINTLNAVTLPDFVQGCTHYILVETAPILQQQSRSWGEKRFDFDSLLIIMSFSKRVKAEMIM